MRLHVPGGRVRIPGDAMRVLLILSSGRTIVGRIDPRHVNLWAQFVAREIFRRAVSQLEARAQGVMQ